MPPFVQLRQPPNDDWVIFDLAVPNLISIRQPPNYEWVQFLVGGGGGLGRFVREFPTVAAMVADITLVANDVCVCIDTTPNRWFVIEASADPLIRNVVLDIAGGAGLQAHQTPGPDGRIYFGPPRGALTDDAADVTATIAYASAHGIANVGALPAGSNWYHSTEVIGSSNVETHWNETDTIHVDLAAPPALPRPAGFVCSGGSPPGGLPHTPLPIDPPTNAWCAYEGSNTVLVASVTLPSPIVVGDEIVIWTSDVPGNITTFQSTRVTGITPSGPNFLLTVEPPIAWPIPNQTIVELDVVLPVFNCVWNGHGATITGQAARCWHFDNVVGCGFKNWKTDNFLPSANLNSFDYGSRSCFGENCKARTDMATGGGAFTIERSPYSSLKDCEANGPFGWGFNLAGYENVVTNPRAVRCGVSYRVVESWHLHVIDAYGNLPSIAMFQMTTVMVGAKNRDVIFENSVFLGQTKASGVWIELAASVCDGVHFQGDHYWEAQGTDVAHNGGATFNNAGNLDVEFDHLVLDGTLAGETQYGVGGAGTGKTHIKQLETFGVAQALYAVSNARIIVDDARIDCTTAIQAANPVGQVFHVFANDNARIEWEDSEIRMRPEAGGAAIVSYGNSVVACGKSTRFVGPSLSWVVFGAGTSSIRMGDRWDKSTVAGGLVFGANLSRGTVQLVVGGGAVAVAFPDITAQDSIKLTPVTYAGAPGAFPTVVITPGTGFAAVGAAGDTSTYAYEVSG